MLPPINSLINWEDDVNTNKGIIEILKEFNLPKDLWPQIKMIYQNQKNLNFKEVFFEKNIKTVLGDIRVDVAIKINDEELLFEPYNTSQIYDDKLQKLLSLGKSVISINLPSFTNPLDCDFCFEEFKSFIQNDVKSKQWIVIRNSKKEELQRNFFEKLKRHLSQKEELIFQYNKIENDVKRNNEKIQSLQTEIYNLSEHNERLEQNKTEIAFSLGFAHN